MKQKLRRIYDDLSNGKLSQAEALERIRALKLQEQEAKRGALLARPIWQASGFDEASSGATPIEYAEQHLVLCELSNIEIEKLGSLLPHCRFLLLDAGQRSTIAERYSSHALACFNLLQTILQGKPQGKVLVQLVVGDREEQSLLAGLSGLLKTAALENPQIAGQVIIAAPYITAEEVARVVRHERTRGLDALVRYEKDERQVLRWREVSEHPGKPPFAFRDQGVYLITGGVGSLGVLFAEEIVERSEARVVLAGRSRLSAAKQAVIDSLSARGGRVSYRQVDVADLDQVTQLITALQEEYGRLDGILHSAGLNADNFILKKGGAEFSEVLVPKIIGTFNLDQASRNAALDLFVLFSSFAGAFGNVGQADYAAANAFMDQFAAHRNRQVAAKQRRGRTLSINWPFWQDGGMSLDSASQERLQQNTGMRPMQTATGLHAFHRCLALPYDQVLVAEGDLAEMRLALFSGRPIEAELTPLPAAAAASGAADTEAAEIDSDATLEGKTRDYLRRQCAEVLKLPLHKIDPQAALEAYGIGSILAMKLTNHLERTFGTLSKTLFFEYQTIAELSRYFVDSHSARLTTLLATGNGSGQPASVAARAEPRAQTKPDSRRHSRRMRSTPGPTTESDPIAMIGLSGRYPEAVDLDAYWRNLRDGKDCIVEIPKERWDWKEYFSDDRTKSGHHYSKWGGFIAGVDEFDPLFFNISPKEAKYIDPQERLFLQQAWMAIEDAGYTRANLQASHAEDLPGQVGVYVGVMYTEYQLFGVEASMRGNRLGIAGSAASIANRVSYAFNLHGPSVTLDTMCSSSLTAIHFACQDLKLDRTSLAIAGGVNVSIHPNKYLGLSAGQFISGDGHCQSFGEGGDGYIPGEGVGVVVLKRLSEAERDGDHIYGIIRGSALNHGGKTNGYTVPNPQAQASAIGQALAESRTDARHVSYIEAHGTGTKLGDPIEIAALNKAFRQYTGDTEFCRIGSAKSNIGHCESAAGMAGLTKVLLQMQHQQIVPSLHSAQLNPHIDFGSSPFVVNQSLTPWERPVINGRTLPRIAGISSFGAGGSNAHLIVEEYESPVQQPKAFASVIIPLSARTSEQLQQKALDLLEFVRGRASAINLVAMAYTLQAGREAMDERLGFLVSSVDQLIEKLQGYVAGQQGIEDAYRGEVKRSREALAAFTANAERQTVEKWIAEGKLSSLVELWVKGLDVHWSKLYGETTPRRMSLPTYPFAKDRHWIEMPQGERAAAKGVVAAVLHPLLHSNTSELSQQSYSSAFSGEEFFLRDHQVAGQRILPAAACLEMARVAVQRSAHASEETLLELRDVVWAQPIVVSASKQVSIALFAGDGDRLDYEIYSEDAGQEIVHCQGRAFPIRRLALPRLDLEQLAGQMGQSPSDADAVYAACARMGIVCGPSLRGIKSIQHGSNQLLAHLRLPANVEDGAADYVLHPSLISGALLACTGLIDGSSEGAQALRLPSTLDSLRVISPCMSEMVAWTRHAPDSRPREHAVKLDIDLCDPRGNVCVQMRGVAWQQASLEIVEPVLESFPAAITDISRASRREIPFASDPRATMPGKRKRPAAITLATPSACAAQPSGSSAPLTLSNATPGVPTSASAVPAVVPCVVLYDDGHGIFSIQITDQSSQDAIARVQQALHRVQQEASVKVLIINGLERCFLRGGREDYNAAVETTLVQAIASFPYPVIAALQGDAVGAAFLAAALCDFMVCSEDATYGYTDADAHLYPTPLETTLFGERFGAVRAQDFLYLSAPATGRQLRAKGWTCPILPTAQVEASARKLASTLAAKPQAALRLLKQHLMRHLAGMAKELTPIGVAVPATESRSNTGTMAIASPAKYIQLNSPVANVLVIKFCAGGETVGMEESVADLTAMFTTIHRNTDYKAIVLVSEHPDFIPGAGDAVAENAILAFQHLVVEAPIPVVAALDGDAQGNAWLLSQFCDACVYSRTGIYSSATVGQNPGLLQTVAAIFALRFGNDVGKEILLTGGDHRGTDLQQRVGTLIVAEQDRVLSAAIEVASFWAKLPWTTLASWKRHTATALQERIRSLPVGWEQKDGTPGVLPSLPTPIALQSRVVTATAHPEGIVIVNMEGREAKNMFSDALMEGLSEAFAHIEQTPAYKVVILTGYDRYFGSGGTKESLLAIQSGAARFTDHKVFQLPLDCSLPVIAAMQGHGIGAGWTLGMFADFALLSEESRYVSPYMDYGFTPGAGATWILADKLGHDLARESLLTAQHYAGGELRERELRLPILPRAEVLPAAMELAKQIARGSRDRLINLKRQLTQYVHQPLDETYRREVAMHQETFVGQSGTLARIHDTFYEEGETPSPAGLPQTRVALVHSPVDSEVLPAVAATLKSLLANELQMRESDIDDNTQFVDLGLDSIGGVTWIRKINEKYHTSIEATKIYNYPTLTELSRYVKEEAERHGTLSSQPAMAAVEAPAPANSIVPQNAIATRLTAKKLTSWRGRAGSRAIAASAIQTPPPIAVIGMAGQFPQAKNVEEFWQNIAQGKNCITEVPAKRWDANAYYHPGDAVAGKTNSKWLGALEEYDLFDPLFFNISPAEAENMDPQQRLFLQACWHSIENAGYDARSLSGSKCGVFVGCACGDYHLLSREQQLSGQSFTGDAPSILAARASYLLNLHGPCLSIDTACSSSLVAIAQACDSLTSGSSDLALAGGVYVMAGPEMHIRTSQVGMLSPMGKCFTFDQRADGLVPGEGVGVVLLKRLADAERDRDIIHAVIQGWGVNQDGKTNGITAPNPDSQTRLEQEVYDKYHIDPAGIQLIEAHGTGTKLGDPIEVEGLKRAFEKYTRNIGYCALGSVKSNIGHCLTAAGIAGVLKLILALKHRQLPPTIHFERLNEHIDLENSPFYVNTRLQDWELRGAPRRQSAISSFGFGGTNAHMVLGEYLPPVEARRPAATVAAPNTTVIIPLSARTAEQLRQRARDLLSFVRDRAASVDLAAIAYSLQVGRTPMDERLGFVVSSSEQLIERLGAYVNGVREIPGFHEGQVKRGNEALSIIIQNDDIKEAILDNWVANKKFSKLLELWVRGLEFDWNRLHGEAKSQRIALPGYPFAKERYWIDTAARQSLAPAAAPSVLHPLLHNNTSDLEQQSYSVMLTGEEFFLSDHQIRADGGTIQKVLPGVAYLEMARAAVERALPARTESTVVELRDVVWVQPVVVGEKTCVNIALAANDHDEIDYEIYSQAGEQQIVHGQGRALLRSELPPSKLDLEQIEREMERNFEPGSVYAAFARMGLMYGPAFQGIVALHRGNGRVLAQLRLPKMIEGTFGDFVLHPSLMDSAVQACVGLIDGSSEDFSHPRVPFALDSLRIVAPCSEEMIASVCYSPGSHAETSVVKLDIDLCDARGNIAVQMRGFSLRVLSREIRTTTVLDRAIGTLVATPVWQASEAESFASSVEYTEHHVLLCEPTKVDVEKLGALLSHVHCVSLQAEHGTVAQRYSDYAVACFERIQAILRGKPQGRVLVQIVVVDHEEQAVFAGLSALLRTAALENPRLVGRLILAAPEMTTEELGGILWKEKSGAAEPVIRYADGGRQGLRWQEVPEEQGQPPIAFRQDGVYLITGGLGALGTLFTKEILERTGRARTVLTGRSLFGAETQARLEALSAEAGRLNYRQLDLCDLDQVRQLIAAIRSEYGQLNGILHSAGTIADEFILKKASAEFSEVLAPKVTGTFHLDQASKDVELDFFVLFSSIAGAVGNLGQADYACANAFMDEFAAYRNRQVAAKQRYGRTRSINWPLWQAGGMTIDPSSYERLQRTTGVRPMRTETGIAAFHHSLTLPYDQILIAEGDPAQMRGAFLGHSAPPAEPQPKQPVLTDIDAESLAERTQDYLVRQLSGLLKLPFHSIDPLAALEKYGIDSILALKLTNHLEQTFGSLSKTLFFEYQTIGELSRYFIQSHSARLATLFAGDDNRGAKPADRHPETVPSVRAKPISSRRFSRMRRAEPTTSDPIAIIGLSGRYPEAVDLEAYWHNLRDGKDCVVEVPPERWDWKEYFSDDRTASGRHFSKWGGFIAGVDEFDPLFFNISPKDAKNIDPQERLFLQHAWMAIEDAGYTRASLQMPCEHDLGGQVGVYAGVMYNEYQLFGAEASVRGERLGVAGSASSIANRVSYALNLHGPSMTLDTMCSSSLTAIHLACQDLRLGRTSLAIAGGVNVSIHPNKYLVLSAGQFISSDGHCQSFGEGGDGYIPGEGVGVVVLKRLSVAERDGDHIYGIIRSSALNHGGKTNGYTVPNPQAQTDAISRALAESGTDARHISYIEAHGTGTKLGDPIEIAALSRAFQHHTQDTGFCLIGSAKSNIGHCESAAGIAGLTKVLLQMQHRQLAPSLHSTQLNPLIEFQTTPFVVNQTLRPWEPPVIEGRTLPRIAGISSFGAGGSNAHMIVEEYQAPVPEPAAVGKVAIVLSAKTAEQLQQKIRDLSRFVRTRFSTIDLAALAYTLQVGREPMEERLGFVVSSVEQLAEKLERHAAGEQSIEDAYQGQAKRHKEVLSLFNTDGDLLHTIDQWIANEKLSKLLELWVKGLELDWSKLYGETKPPRMSLPAYPFAKERYWIDTAAARPVPAGAAAGAVLHPLLHSNTSDPSEQRYTSTFTGEEFFLADHQVAANGHTARKVLPGAAYLEMARVAIEHAFPAWRESAVLELRDTVWTHPIIKDGKKRLDIALVATDDDQVDFEIYSQDAEREIVHCQGSAVLSRQAAPAVIDIEQLMKQLGSRPFEPSRAYAARARMGLIHGPSLQGITAIHQDGDRLLARLRLPKNVEHTSGDYVLHPSLMESALQAAVALIDGGPEFSNQPRLPFALEALRIVSPCSPAMLALVRYAPGTEAADTEVKLDLDLCDESGKIAVQMRGVRWRLVSVDAAVEPVLDPASSPVIRAPRKEIILAPSASPLPMLVERNKPRAISLAPPSALVASPAPVNQQSPPLKTSVALSNATLGVSAPSVSVFDRGDGVFSIQIATSLNNDAIADLLRALDRVQQEPSVKVLLLNGFGRGFARGGIEDYNAVVDRKLYHALVSFPYPIVTVLEGDAVGAGFLAAALCDFMVCNEDATYGFTDAEHHVFPTTAVSDLFSERFGDVGAQDFLYVSTRSTGRQLRTRGWTCPIVPAADVEAHARELAASLAEKSRDALRLLKRHLARRLVGLVAALTPGTDAAPVLEDQSHSDVVSPVTHVRISTGAEHVLVVTFASGEAKELLADLRRIFIEIRQNRYYKAVVLVSGALQSVAEDGVLEFQRLLIESEIPVVAALAGNATGEAWLVSLFCDACVHSRTGVYSAAALGENAALAQTVVSTLTDRFGADAGKEILLTGADYSGGDLQRRVGTVLVAEQDDVVLPAAIRVAAGWAGLPRPTLASWKKHRAAVIKEKISSLPAWEPKGETPEPLIAAPMPIALRSHAVTASAHPGGIVVVKMQDRQAKNMFSEALIEGLTEVFALVERAAYRVVILTGYDSYFATGGTKESLLAIQAGKAKFTDTKIFQLALDCKLPVIAAMQGHGIGAGWSLGMFADIVLLSEESRYVSPYMKYGFTPGAGATWILPERIGPDLARESLLTAQPCTGREMKERGLRLAILPRAEVDPAAMALARQMARASRHCLMGLKQQWTASVHQPLEDTYRLEVAMHEKTFVGQAETLAQIHTHFYEESEQPVRIEAATQSGGDSDALPAVMATLTTLLANELQMRESDVDENAQFVDLGLDSISGVTWIRKINETYRLSIEATKVYNFPTLAQLGRYVKEEAEKHGTLPGPVAVRTAELPAVSGKTITVQDTMISEPEVEVRKRRRRRATLRVHEESRVVGHRRRMIWRSSGKTLPRERIASARCRSSDGIWTPTIRPAKRCQGRRTASGWEVSKNTIGLTRVFSTSRRRKPRTWIRSSACSFKRAGTVSKTRDTTREHCRGASAGCSWVVPRATITSRRGRTC